MNKGKTIFARYCFKKCIDRYKGDRLVIKFNCRDQFMVMSFAQFTDRSDLRGIETTLNLCGNLYRSGMPKSTLSEVNEKKVLLHDGDAYTSSIIKMKKVLLSIICVLVCCCSFSQTNTVSQLESKWRSLYRNGITAMESHDYDRAEELLKSSISLLRENNATRNNLYIGSLIKLCENYHASSQDSSATAILQEVLAYKAILDTESTQYADYMLKLGDYYLHIKQYNAAMKVYDEALSNIDSKEKSLAIMHKKAFCHYCLGTIEKAVLTEEQCVGKDNNKTSDYIKSLAYYYYVSKQWDKLEGILPDAFQYSRESILRKFSQSREEERSAFWSNAGTFFSEYIPAYTSSHPSETIASYAYDAALFSKGILLASEVKSNDLILDSNDPELIRLYSQYQELKRKKLRSLNEDVELESISQVLLRHQREHKYDFRQDFRISWKNLRDNLQEGDIAIEFITVPGDGGYDYAALVLKKDYSAPRFVKLADYKEIAEVRKRLYYTTSRLYNLIWKPLEKELDGVSKVFFAPAGIIYNIGIEYMPNDEGVVFCSEKRTYRLSSTKELVLNRTHSFQEGVLFGGLDYDAKPYTPTQAPKSSTGREPWDSLRFRGAAISSSFNYLPGTFEEVQEISDILKNTHISTTVFSGESGSETTFKNLTETTADFLHLATHGFYFTDNHAGQIISLDSDFKRSVSSDELVEPLFEDKMLTRSGLILAGANNSLGKPNILDNVDDGILYADEIADLNLNNIDLLVLSACQSGLGDIASSEGVFGLQRGFKLAGVHSIIMSMWEVDDEATKILMTELYKNIAKGLSKQESFLNAQNALKTIDDGLFDDPDYWAAFVLLDGLE